MRTYRCYAELRRLHRAGDWHLAGVVVDGDWHPIQAGIARPGHRAIEAGLVTLDPLPPLLARDRSHALAVSRRLALDLDRPLWGHRPKGEVFIELP